MNRILCLFDYITIAENAVNDCFYGYLRAKTVQSKIVYATVKRKKDFCIGVKFTTSIRRSIGLNLLVPGG